MLRTEQIELLLRCAEKANVGMENGSYEVMIVYADDIRNMRAFATALIDRRAEFKAVSRTHRKASY